jgi:AraC-like DNA-binding protein
MRTRNLDEAIDAVSKVYCPHAIKVVGPARNINAVLEIAHPTSQPLVWLSYSTAVDIDAGNFPELFLMMHCARGSASTTQEYRSAEWRSGQTMPFSAGFDTKLRFDRAFAQNSVRLDQDKLETLCARWLGRPLEQPLRFALRPFSQEFEQFWQHTLRYIHALGDSGYAPTGSAKAAFDEYLLTSLLQHHPHNYSAEMTESGLVPVPGLVRRAERYMIDNAERPITVSDVAAELGVSVRTLQTGFRAWRNTTPNTFFRDVRLRLVRDELRRSGAEATVTATAMRYGFSHLGRFAAYYQSAFGETPSVTLRRNRVSRLSA